MSNDDTEDLSKYKAKNNREIDNLFRANGFIQSQVAGTDAYRRGHIWNFEWCSSDPAVARPTLVRAVEIAMEGGMSFEDAFNSVYAADQESKRESR